MCTAPGTHVYLKYFGKNNEKVRVGVDPTSEHPDPKSDPNDPRWLCVDVKFVKKYPDVLSLAAIKADTVLRTMRVAEKGSRLSITPVTKTQYQQVLDLVKK
ncbi:MAG: EVE domain-containing protein [Candidatus Paceibacterota bacterium]